MVRVSQMIKKTPQTTKLQNIHNFLAENLCNLHVNVLRFKITCKRLLCNGFPLRKKRLTSIIMGKTQRVKFNPLGESKYLRWIAVSRLMLQPKNPLLRWNILTCQLLFAETLSYNGLDRENDIEFKFCIWLKSWYYLSVIWGNTIFLYVCGRRGKSPRCVQFEWTGWVMQHGIRWSSLMAANTPSHRSVWTRASEWLDQNRSWPVSFHCV